MGFLYQTLFLSTLVFHAMCYPDGVGVDSACSNLTPRHGLSSQSSNAPYTVTFHPTSFTPGQTITVTITSSSIGFKGFMIQARRADTNQNQELLGSFSGNPDTTRPACSGKALVHTNNVPKSSLTFNWMAPTTPVGNTVFRVTFVQREDYFWVNRMSSVLVEAIPTTTTAPRPTTTYPPTITTTYPPPTTTTYPPPTTTTYPPPTTNPPTAPTTYPPSNTAKLNEESTPSTENEVEPGCTRYCRDGYNSNNYCWSCCWDMVVERYGNLPVNSMNSRYFRARQIFLYGQVRQCMREFMDQPYIRL